MRTLGWFFNHDLGTLLCRQRSEFSELQAHHCMLVYQNSEPDSFEV